MIKCRTLEGFRTSREGLRRASSPAPTRSVETAGQHRPRVRARVRWMDRSPSKRSRAGSTPAGRTRPRSPTGRTPRYERGGWRFESSRGHETRAWFNRRTPVTINCRTLEGFRTSREGLRRASTPAPTRSPETRVRLPPLAPRDPCSRKHLVRLPGCLPGEAGSIPVGGAKTWPMFVSAGASGRGMSGRIGFDPRRQDESAWRNWHTRRAQASLLFRVRIPERSRDRGGTAYAAG